MKHLPLSLACLLVVLVGCGDADAPVPDGAPQADPARGAESESVAAGAETGSAEGDASAADDGDATEPAEAGELVVERGAPITQKPEPSRAQRTAEAIQQVASGIEGMDLLNIAAITDVVPKVDEKGVLPISWERLSLRELYGDRLNDLLNAGAAPGMVQDDGGEQTVAFPESVVEVDGKRVAVLGYMIPFDFGATEVTEFMLVRDLAGCCFGGAAQPDEWISVTMVEGGAEYVPYTPVIVIGTLTVGGFEDWTYSTGCYALDGESVRTQL